MLKGGCVSEPPALLSGTTVEEHSIAQTSSAERRQPPSRICRVAYHGFMPLYLVCAATAIFNAPPDEIAWVSLLYTVVLFLAERLIPANKEWNYPLNFKEGGREFLADVFYILLSGQLGTRIVQIVASYAAFRARDAWSFNFWPMTWPFWAQLVLAALIYDFVPYFQHRAAHRWEIIWRFHATHHYPERMNVLKGSRNHPLDFFFLNVGGIAVLFFLGVPSEVFLPMTLTLDLLNTIAHSNINVSDRFIGWFFVTPHLHHIHHSATLEESKSNFGCRLIVWDRVFGTFRPRFKEESAPLLGVSPRRPRSIYQQLVAPLYRRRYDEP